MANSDKHNRASSSATDRDKEFLNKNPSVTSEGSSDDGEKRSLSHNVGVEKVSESQQTGGRTGRAREADDINNDRVHDSRHESANPDTSAQAGRPPSSDHNATPVGRGTN